MLEDKAVSMPLDYKKNPRQWFAIRDKLRKEGRWKHDKPKETEREEPSAKRARFEISERDLQEAGPSNAPQVSEQIEEQSPPICKYYFSINFFFFFLTECLHLYLLLKILLLIVP